MPPNDTSPNLRLAGLRPPSPADRRPCSSKDSFQFLQHDAARGVSVLVTTHLLAEGAALADAPVAPLLPGFDQDPITIVSISSRSTRTRRTAPPGSASRVVSPKRTSVASSGVDFAVRRGREPGVDAVRATTPSSRGAAGPGCRVVRRGGGRRLEPTARVDIAPEVEDDVGVHAVRRARRVSRRRELWHSGESGDLSARDARVDAAAQERRARHRRAAVWRSDEPVKQLISNHVSFRETTPSRKDLRTACLNAPNTLVKLFPKTRASVTMKQHVQ